LLTVILFGGKALAQTCTQTPFPKFVGGTNSGTFFYSIDYHSATSQLVAGGSTRDSGITNGQDSFSEIPIIVSYQGASFAYSWGIYDPTDWAFGLDSISISSDGSFVLAQLISKILVLSATNGSLIKAITHSYSFYKVGYPYKSLGMNSDGKILFTGN